MVSIIIPAYNVENYIFRGIESCMNQTNSDIEIVIVDDGSTDNTYRVLMKYSTLDKRIRVYRQENKGVSSARNKGIEEARGEYVIFLDSDDWLEPETIDELLDKGRQGFLTCLDYNLIHMKKGNLEEVAHQQVGTEEAVIYKDKLIQCFCLNKYRLGSACYKLFNRKILLDNHIAFNPGIHDGEDGLFVFQYLLCVDGIVYRDKKMWNILERPDSATNSGYSWKVATAIDAAEIILNYKKYNSSDMTYLKSYYTSRAICVKFSAVKQKKSPSAEEMRRINMALRAYVREFIKCNRQLSERLKVLTIAYLPYIILKPMLCIKSSIKERIVPE